MLTLLNVPISPYGRKVEMVLLEKGLPFTMREPDLEAAGRGEDPELAAVSPRLTVPCLIDGDTHVVDSTVILEYVEERWPEPPMLPATPAERARVRMLEDVCDTTYEAVVWGVYETQMMAGRVPDELKPVLLGTAADQIRGLNAHLARQLDGRAWFNGDRFGWADCAVFPHVSGAAALGFPPDDARLASWLETVALRPSALRVAAELQEWFTTPLNRPTDARASWKRLYRDHRLEWMIRAGGVQVVVDGLRNDTIRFSRDVA